MNLLQKYISNGTLVGDAGDMLLASNGDPNVLRPWLGEDGKTSYITTFNKMGQQDVSIVHNVHATLRKDDWKTMDDAVVKAAQERLKLVNFLRGRGLTYSIAQGMGKTILETETQGEVNDAIISMDGLRESVNDRPEFEPSALPLPITHKDFQFSARTILVSRNGGSPLDTTSAELSARKVAESIERLALGRNAIYTYGGGTVYGLLNFPSRMTRTITTPVGAGAGFGATFLLDVLAMRAQSVAQFHFGPWILFVAPNWDTYLDQDYKANGDKTCRERVASVNGLVGIETLDFMQNYDVLLVQLTSDIIRIVIGMDIITLQWDTKGGMQKNFKVMSIVVPQLRADFNSRTAIVHGSV